MQRAIVVLSILLIGQLLLAGAMSLIGPSLAAVRPDAPLLDLGGRSVDRVTIEGAETERLVLARHGDTWVLPDAGEFPADGAKVERLLERLAGLKRGAPIATSSGARERFKVSDEAFERRLEVAHGEEILATLYLGTSPGVREVHISPGGDDAVYVAALGVHEASDKATDWEDKSVLQIPSADIEKVLLPGLVLQRVTSPSEIAEPQDEGTSDGARGSWAAEELADSEVLNQKKVETLVGKLAGLRIGSVLGTKPEPANGLDDPVLVVRLERRGGEPVEYRLGRRDSDGDYVLKSSARAEYFRLPSYTGDAIIEAAAREQLVAKESDPQARDEASSEQVESNPEIAPDPVGG